MQGTAFMDTMKERDFQKKFSTVKWHRGILERVHWLAQSMFRVRPKVERKSGCKNGQPSIAASGKHVAL